MSVDVLENPKDDINSNEMIVITASSQSHHFVPHDISQPSQHIDALENETIILTIKVQQLPHRLPQVQLPNLNQNPKKHLNQSNLIEQIVFTLDEILEPAKT